jgi:hypothetical protein
LEQVQQPLLLVVQQIQDQFQHLVQLHQQAAVLVELEHLHLLLVLEVVQQVVLEEVVLTLMLVQLEILLL